MQFSSGSDQRLGRDAEGLGSTDEIRLMGRKEIENGREDGRVADSGAQRIRRKPGQRQQPPGTGFILEKPAECTEGKGMRISRG